MPVALVVVGAALEIFVGGTAGIIGAGLIGIAVVLGIANAFYEVGRSEDREREREAAALRPPTGPEASNGRARRHARPSAGVAARLAAGGRRGPHD